MKSSGHWENGNSEEKTYILEHHLSRPITFFLFWYNLGLVLLTRTTLSDFPKTLSISVKNGSNMATSPIFASFWAFLGIFAQNLPKFEKKIENSTKWPELGIFH